MKNSTDEKKDENDKVDCVPGWVRNNSYEKTRRKAIELSAYTKLYKILFLILVTILIFSFYNSTCKPTTAPIGSTHDTSTIYSLK